MTDRHETPEDTVALLRPVRSIIQTVQYVLRFTVPRLIRIYFPKTAEQLASVCVPEFMSVLLASLGNTYGGALIIVSCDNTARDIISNGYQI